MTPLQKLIAGLFAGAFALTALADEMAESVDRQFKAQDANHDGKLSPQESADGAKRMFQAMDGNHDGKVNAAEMDKAQQAITGREAGASDLTSEEKIRMVDTNRDGVLTATEHAEGAKAMFTLMDLDTDGYVTKDELVQGHEEMLQKDARR